MLKKHIIKNVRMSLAAGIIILLAVCAQTNAELGSFKVPGNLLETSVVMQTTDVNLQKLYDCAEDVEKGNITAIAPKMNVLKEGGGYENVWLETQPMGGSMYAKRNLEVALNNQLVFMKCQRKDGKIPGMIRSRKVAIETGLDKPDHCPPNLDMNFDKDLVPDYRYIQGFYFPEYAYEMYFWINKDKAYLKDLYKTLEAFDNYLWRVRDSDKNGVLETWCAWDTGEDTGIRYMGATNAWPFEYPPNDKGAWVWATTFERITEPEQMSLKDPATFDKAAYDKLFKGKKLYSENPTPIESMDFMGFSYTGRSTLAKISRELGNGKEKYWQEKAQEVRDSMMKNLWRPEKHAFDDMDKYNKFMGILSLNNLRVLHFGACSQDIADEFIRYHLLNPDEFWTSFPLPFIAINDPMFRNVHGSNWSGQAMSLTYQRAIRALENYGHFAELTLLGHKWLNNLEGQCGFYQQFDPFTGQTSGPTAKTDYGPTALTILEYISRMYGVYLDFTNDRIFWSGLDRNGQPIRYTQKWGKNEYTVDNKNGELEGLLNGRKIFSCTAGTRVVTDFEGNVLEVVGIDSVPHLITLHVNSVKSEVMVQPNQVFEMTAKGELALKKAVAFDYPYKRPDSSK